MEALHRSVMPLISVVKLTFDLTVTPLVLYCMLSSISSQSLLWTSIALASIIVIILTLSLVLYLRRLKARLHKAESLIRQLETEHLVLMSENADLTSTLTRSRVREMRLEKDCTELRIELNETDEVACRLQTVREKLLRVCADRNQAVQCLERDLEVMTARAECAREELADEIEIARAVEEILDTEMQMLTSGCEEAVEKAQRSDEDSRRVAEELDACEMKLARARSRIAELEREVREHEQESYAKSSVCFEMLKWYEVPESSDPEGEKGV